MPSWPILQSAACHVIQKFRRSCSLSISCHHVMRPRGKRFSRESIRRSHQPRHRRSLGDRIHGQRAASQRIQMMTRNRMIALQVSPGSPASRSSCVGQRGRTSSQRASEYHARVAIDNRKKAPRLASCPFATGPAISASSAYPAPLKLRRTPTPIWRIFAGPDGLPEAPGQGAAGMVGRWVPQVSSLRPRKAQICGFGVLELRTKALDLTVARGPAHAGSAAPGPSVISVASAR